MHRTTRPVLSKPQDKISTGFRSRFPRNSLQKKRKKDRKEPYDTDFYLLA
jgi:hypothetical protein